MDPVALVQAVAGGVLLFFLPGYAVARAVFPERRVRGPTAVGWVLELVALAFVLSVVLTVVVGYVLLAGTSGGFSASWSDPRLEVGLAAITLVAFVAGWLEGAYARTPPPGHRIGADPGTARPWELSDRLDRLQRERIGLERRLRATPASDADRIAELTADRDHVVAEEERLRQRREADYEL